MIYCLPLGYFLCRISCSCCCGDLPLQLTIIRDTRTRNTKISTTANKELWGFIGSVLDVKNKGEDCSSPFGCVYPFNGGNQKISLPSTLEVAAVTEDLGVAAENKELKSSMLMFSMTGKWVKRLYIRPSEDFSISTM